MNKRYHWQPELSITIIYWSVTLMILFYSLTLSLENTRPYLKSNLVMGVFFIFVLIGLLRWMVVKENCLECHYSRFWLNRQFFYEQMEDVVVEKNALEFFYQGKHYHFIFRKATLAKLLPELKVKLSKQQIIEKITTEEDAS